VAEGRARLGGLALRACAWALGGRCERADLRGAGRGRWHVSMVPRGRRRWGRVTVEADSVAEAVGRLVRATRGDDRRSPPSMGRW
jgi:hypothetical protein